VGCGVGGGIYSSSLGTIICFVLGSMMLPFASNLSLVLIGFGEIITFVAI